MFDTEMKDCSPKPAIPIALFRRLCSSGVGQNVLSKSAHFFVFCGEIFSQNWLCSSAAELQPQKIYHLFSLQKQILAEFKVQTFWVLSFEIKTCSSSCQWDSKNALSKTSGGYLTRPLICFPVIKINYLKSIKFLFAVRCYFSFFWLKSFEAALKSASSSVRPPTASRIPGDDRAEIWVTGCRLQTVESVTVRLAVDVQPLPVARREAINNS